ncbi:MAG: amidohydrolase family protein [Chloroflexi bacterium]|nr:amidohydrolase family protein [Chloroflexota bacterium]
MYDVLLRGGQVVDGSGAPAVHTDVAVIGDEIVALGDLREREARRTLDLHGQVLAPGVVDIHSHADFTFLEERSGRSAIRQGVTTEVVGNCGQSYAPVTERNRQAVSDRSAGWQPSVDVSWSSTADYLAEVRRGNGVNAVYLVGHGTLRSAVMGTVDRPATDDEIGQMQTLLDEALADGARGMSTGLEFMPGRPATPPELGSLATTVGRRGGLVASHIRNRDRSFEAAVEEMLTATRVGEAKLQLSHLMVKPGHAPGAWERVVGQMETARGVGQDVVADMIPYDTGPGLATGFLPGWALDGGPAATLARLRAPESYARIRADYDRYWLFVAMGEWDRLTLAFSQAHPDWIGQRFDQLADELGMEPIDLLLQVLIDEGEGLDRITVNGRLFDEAHVRACLTHPLFLLSSDSWRGTRDGGPGEVANHPSCWGWVPRILGHYVREAGVLSLVEAVRKMTSEPAMRLGLADRGTIRPGARADLMSFDPGTVGTTATFASPAQRPVGIQHVFVNGIAVLEEGVPTGALPGRLL